MRVFALFTFALSLTVFRVQSGDVLMYLALARDFIFGSIRGDVDPYLYSLPNATLVWTHEWLSYVLFYGAWTLAGAAGLILLKSLTLAAIFVRTLRARAGGLWPGLWLIGITAASFRFVERGSLFSDLALVILVDWLIEAPRMTRVLALRLTLLFAIWTQLHPGYPLGFAFLGLWAIHRRIISLYFLAPIFAPLLNLDGWRGYAYPFRFALNEARVLKHFNFEWFPSYHPAFRFAPETIAYWIFAALALTVVARRPSRARDFRTWVIVAALLCGTLAVRFVPFAVFATLIAIGPWTALSVRIPRWLEVTGCAVLIALAAKNVTFGYESSSGPRRPGFGFDPKFFPTGNLALLRAHPIPGRLYESQDFGATLIWEKMTPIFDHGFVTDMRFYRYEVVAAISSAEGFFKLAERWNWTMLLVEKRNAYKAFYDFLKDRPEWRIVGEDEASYLIYRLP